MHEVNKRLFFVLIITFVVSLSVIVYHWIIAREKSLS